MDLKQVDVMVPQIMVYWHYGAINVQLGDDCRDYARLRLDVVGQMLEYFVFDVTDGNIPLLVNPRLKPQFGGPPIGVVNKIELVEFVDKFRADIRRVARKPAYKEMSYPAAVRLAVERVAMNNRLELAGLNEVSPDELVEIVKRRRKQEIK